MVISSADTYFDIADTTVNTSELQGITQQRIMPHFDGGNARHRDPYQQAQSHPSLAGKNVKRGHYKPISQQREQFFDDRTIRRQP